MTINSNAAGMAVAQSLDFEFDFARNPISGSAALFFVIILKIIFTAIFDIKVHVKKFLGKKKSFPKPHFYKPIHILVKLITTSHSLYKLNNNSISTYLNSKRRR